MKKKDFQKIKNTCGKFLRHSAEWPLSTFLVLFFLVLILGGLSFYKYSILTQKVEPEIIEQPAQFQENLYQKILKEWQDKEQRFEAATAKKYDNPFQKEREIIVQDPEQGIVTEPLVQELLGASNLLEFYAIRGERLPSQGQRALLWESKGLGSAYIYIGTQYQNHLLLNELKKELTE